MSNSRFPVCLVICVASFFFSWKKLRNITEFIVKRKAAIPQYFVLNYSEENESFSMFQYEDISVHLQCKQEIEGT